MTDATAPPVFATLRHPLAVGGTTHPHHVILLYCQSFLFIVSSEIKLVNIIVSI